METNMTALISLYARAYHNKNNKYKIYEDAHAEQLLSKEEYTNISMNMQNGIDFFNPTFKGTKDEALRWIIDNQISPSVIGRSKYAQLMLNNAIKLGCKQYMIFASGYDTSAYKVNRDISVFELDLTNVIDDKLKRLKIAGVNHENVNYIKCDFTDKKWIKQLMNSSYDKEKTSFSTLLGISYYLTKTEFREMLKMISENIFDSSSLVFDYQTETSGVEVKKNEQLALAANSEMKAKYTFEEMTNLLEECHLLIYENLNENKINRNIFYDYNTLNPNNRITAPVGVNYCLCVKKI